MTECAALSPSGVSGDPYVASLMGNTLLNATGNTATAIIGGPGGQPNYTGPMGSGIVAQSKVYGFLSGIADTSNYYVDGKVTKVNTITFGSNVVSGATRPYSGGIMAKNNRIE